MGAHVRSMSEVSEFFSVPLESVPTDLSLPYAVFVKIGGNLVLFRNKKDQLTPARLAQLHEKKVDVLYINQEDWQLFLVSLENSIDEIGIAAGNENAAMGLRSLLFAYGKTIEETRQIEPSIFAKLREACAKIPLTMQKNRTLATKLIRKYNDPSVYFTSHNLNVIVYSVAVGLKMRLPIDEVQELALAACLANIGIIQIPKAILYKPEPLTPKEQEVVREHPQAGYQLLRILLVPLRVCEAALQHHERMDGKGYPNGLKGDTLGLFPRVISVAEVYDALTSRRPWEEAMEPHLAIQKMQEIKGKFDPAILASVVGG